LVDIRAENGSVIVGTSSIRILSENNRRVYALITNDSSNTVYLSLGSEACMNKGIRLTATGGSFEINKDNLFKGKISGISSASSTVLVVEVSE